MIYITEIEPRNFVLRDEDGNEHGVFTGKQPRQAALKAAKRGKGTKTKPEIMGVFAYPAKMGD